jgi:uncharacterized SAM-binding protein YcdF (DUF218 family)
VTWVVVLGCLAGGGWGLFRGAAAALELHRPLARADAIVIMAGSGAYRERTATAAALFAEGRAPLVALTDEGTRAGWSETEQRNPTFAELAVRSLVAAGVPETSIVVLPVPPAGRPTGTAGEAEGLLAWTGSAGIRSIIIVTSSYHSRRAAWTVASVLPDDVVIGVEPVASGRDAGEPWRPRAWRRVVVEYAKWAYQALFAMTHQAPRAGAGAAAVHAS